MSTISEKRYLLFVMIGSSLSMWIAYPTAGKFLDYCNRVLSFLHTKLNLDITVVAACLAILGLFVFSIALFAIILSIGLIGKKGTTHRFARAIEISLVSFVAGLIAFYGFGILYQSLGLIFLNFLNV